MMTDFMAIMLGQVYHNVALQGEKYVCLVFYPMDFVYAESIIPFSNR